MKTLYLECFSGISGDMFLGAMVDLGVDFEYLQKKLNQLSMSDEFELKKKTDKKLGITGTKVDVVLLKAHYEGDNVHEHHHRHYHDIVTIIENAPYSYKVKQWALAIFKEIAIAEGKIHGQSIEEVHFHEVGAVDSIVDIIGACLCYEYLQEYMDVSHMIASPVELGGGFVKCAHGMMPVPAPATLELSKGMLTTKGRVDFETATPTGVAILKVLCDQFIKNDALIFHQTAYGLGTKDAEIPNVLRISIVESDRFKSDSVYVLESNIDDMNPEMYEFVEKKLYDLGVKDVYKTPIMMKKGRPGVVLTVIANEELIEDVAYILFTETTTLGLRKEKIERMCLDRKNIVIETSIGEVSVKEAYYKNRLIKRKAEYEDCVRLAIHNGLSLIDVYKIINREMNDLL